MSLKSSFLIPHVIAFTTLIFITVVKDGMLFLNGTLRDYITIYYIYLYYIYRYYYITIYYFKVLYYYRP